MTEIAGDNIDNINIRVKIVSPRLIILGPTNPSYETYFENDINLKYVEKRIQSLNIDGLEVVLDKVITLDKKKYMITKIRKLDLQDVYGEAYYLYTHSFNNSFYFIMPVLGFQQPNYRVDTDFCNCFIGIEGEEEYGEYIYLLYRWNGTKNFLEFESNIQNHAMYIKSIHTDQYHIMYKFRIPERFKNDINLILEGKYSYISPEYKERILHFHMNKNEVLEDVLSRADSRRLKLERDYGVIIPKTLDLRSKPEIMEEIFLDKYRIPKESNNLEF